jgi:O-antigen/teichoic acid export membrane protein
MSSRIKPILGAAVTGLIVNFVGLTYFFVPIRDGDTAPEAMAPWLSLIVTVAVFVVLLDWVNQAVGNALKSALIIAISQILLVDLFYPLSGQRGWATAGASVVVLLVGWCLIGWVYSKLLDAEPAPA